MVEPIYQPATADFSMSSLIASRRDEITRAIELEESEDLYETVWVNGAAIHEKVVPDPSPDSDLSDLEDDEGYLTPVSGWESEEPWNEPSLQERSAVPPSTVPFSLPLARPAGSSSLHPSPSPSPRPSYSNLVPPPGTSVPVDFLHRRGSAAPSSSSRCTTDDEASSNYGSTQAGHSRPGSRAGHRTRQRRASRTKRKRPPTPEPPTELQDTDSDIEQGDATQTTSSHHTGKPRPPPTKRLKERATLHPTEIDATNLPHSRQGYIGSPNTSSTPSGSHQPPTQTTSDEPIDHRVAQMQQLKAEGYVVVKAADAPALFGDRERRIAAWRLGVPTMDPEAWPDRVRRLQHGVDVLMQELGIPSTQPCEGKGKAKAKAGSPRGDFACAHFGYSYGGGQKTPCAVRQTSRRKRRTWDKFLKRRSVRLTTGFISHSFNTWSPGLYKLYSETHAKVTEQYGLKGHAIGGNCPFAAITVNFGPQTVCFQHRDLKNLAFGGCPIVVLGDFNSELGGHIILHELKLIVEMRPGDIIFIPSAVVTHETMPIGPGETRQSIALYSAGGLFRCVDAGFQSYGSWEKNDKAAYDQHMTEGEKRWTEGWSLFTTHGEPGPSTQ